MIFSNKSIRTERYCIGGRVGEWVVALEATPAQREGARPLSELARRLHAVGEIRAEASAQRYSVLVRRGGADPAEALQTAIADWQAAQQPSGARDAQLVGARIVTPPDAQMTPITESRRAQVVRALPRPLAIVGAALVVVLGAWAAFGLLTNSSSAGRRPTLAAPVASQNLVTEGSMEDPTGFARQFHLWGAAHRSFVDHPVAEGDKAVRIDVPAGQQGGFWTEVPVQAATAYDASAAIQVLNLGPSSRLELTIEWYDAAHQLRGYRMLGVPSADVNLVRRVQEAVAPGGAATARVAVNVTQGGAYIVDDVRLGPR
jgi:hypothetical protein